MTNNNFLKKLKELMADPSQMTMDKLKNFIDETTQFFMALQERAKSGDLSEKQKAIEETLAIKAALEEQMTSISKMTGMTPEQMMAFGANSMSAQTTDWKVMEEAMGKLKGKSSQPTPEPKPFHKIVG